MPTVCGLCPVGCNVSRDDARGQGQADPLPQPPGGRRGLALRQGPLRLHAPARRRPARRAAAPRPAGAARGRLLGRRARRGRAMLRDGRAADRDRALRLGDDRAGLGAREADADRPRRARGGAARAAERRARRLPRCRSRRSATRRSSSSSATSRSSSARRSSTSGSRPPARRRRDRHALGPAGDVRAPAAPGRDARRAAELGGQLRAAERAVLIWSGDGGPPSASPRSPHELGFAGKPGCGAFYLPRDPERPRRHRRVGRGRRRGAGRRRADRTCSSSPATRPPPTRPSARWPSRPSAVLAIDDVRGARRAARRPRPARDELPRARRDDDEPRGPPAAAAPHGDGAVPGRDRHGSPSSPSASTSRSRRTRRSLFDEVAAVCYPGISFGDDRRAADAAAAPGRAARRAPAPAARQAPAGGRLPARPLPAALLRPRRRARPRAPVPAARRPRSSSRAPTRARLGIAARRRRPRQLTTARRSSCARASPATCRAGVVRIAEEHAGELEQAGRGDRA